MPCGTVVRINVTLGIQASRFLDFLCLNSQAGCFIHWGVDLLFYLLVFHKGKIADSLQKTPAPLEHVCLQDIWLLTQVLGLTLGVSELQMACGSCLTSTAGLQLCPSAPQAVAAVWGAQGVIVSTQAHPNLLPLSFC